MDKHAHQHAQNVANAKMLGYIYVFKTAYEGDFGSSEKKEILGNKIGKYPNCVDGCSCTLDQQVKSSL